MRAVLNRRIVLVKEFETPSALIALVTVKSGRDNSICTFREMSLIMKKGIK